MTFVLAFQNIRSSWTHFGGNPTARQAAKHIPSAAAATSAPRSKALNRKRRSSGGAAVSKPTLLRAFTGGAAVATKMAKRQLDEAAMHMVQAAANVQCKLAGRANNEGPSHHTTAQAKSHTEHERQTNHKQRRASVVAESAAKAGHLAKHQMGRAARNAVQATARLQEHLFKKRRA